MARPHIEFIQSQVLPFTQGLYGGSRPEVDMRILSIDDEGGDASTQLRWPAGWSRTEPEYLDCDEEFLVLEGALEINGTLYRKHDYAHLPRGYLRKTQSSATGAVTLSFFSSEPHAIQSDVAGNGFDPKRLVEHIETITHESMTDVGEKFDTPDWDPTGTFHKSLYEDPYTGERTWMIGMAPHWSTNLCEIHPVVEEEFSILGDLCFPHGEFSRWRLFLAATRNSAWTIRLMGRVVAHCPVQRRAFCHGVGRRRSSGLVSGVQPHFAARV